MERKNKTFSFPNRHSLIFLFLFFQIADSLGFEGKPLSEFMDVLRNDPKFYYGSREELLDGFKHLVEKRIQPNLRKIFHKDPAHGVV